MKRGILGTLVGIGLVMAAAAMAEQRGDYFGPRGAIPATPVTTAQAGGELIVVSTSVADKVQMLTVVDPRQRVLSVYHIDTLTGKIALKSVRNIQWDLHVNDLNNEKPLPQEIRSLLEQK
jgi:hypothetical protein